MKKPNITEGEWVIDTPDSDTGLVLVNTTDELTIHDGFDIANAKAISAVPDMIDELIDNIKLIQKLRDGYSVDREELNEHWTNTYYALIKAGCTE